MHALAAAARPPARFPTRRVPSGVCAGRPCIAARLASGGPGPTRPENAAALHASTTRAAAAANNKGEPTPTMPQPPGRPLTPPPPLWTVAALGGLTWVSLLGFPGSPLPEPMRALGLAVVTEATARKIAVAAWGAHALEAVYAAGACLAAGADAGAAAFWAFWAFFAGFPALVLMSKTLPPKEE
jgi:hypothetical protein